MIIFYKNALKATQYPNLNWERLLFQPLYYTKLIKKWLDYVVYIYLDLIHVYEFVVSRFNVVPDHVIALLKAAKESLFIWTDGSLNEWNTQAWLCSPGKAIQYNDDLSVS